MREVFYYIFIEFGVPKTGYADRNILTHLVRVAVVKSQQPAVTRQWRPWPIDKQCFLHDPSQWLRNATVKYIMLLL
jgi:hypothetical protein